MKIDKDLIKQLSESLNEFHLTELEYSDGKTTIKVGKGSKAITTTSPTTESSVKTQAQKEDTSSNIVRSPMVGTAYLSPEPGAKPFVSVGNKVKKGDTILIIEAMKTMNHIQSTVDGEVIEILINDGEAVEFEQALAKIK
ncbi:MAG: acetyl-CoA carboxylase biotin carboxyl carrier protein [Pelagibacteraceae bacterium]|jgi:acetyl-CoA carboxylase biotin carboxyl carrier protein